MKEFRESQQKSEEQARSLAVLEKLLAELSKEHSPQADFVREHLDGARFYLTGSMPQEMALNLKLAEESLDALPDKDLKSRIQEFLETQRSRE